MSKRIDKDKFLEPFNHIKTLRSALKDVTSEQLSLYIDKMKTIHQEKVRLEEAARMEQEIQEKNLRAAVQAVDSILEQKGLEFDDILKAKAIPKRKAKYVLNINGKDIFYVGTGRKPKEIDEYLSQGGKLEDLEIK